MSDQYAEYRSALFVDDSLQSLSEFYLNVFGHGPGLSGHILGNKFGQRLTEEIGFPNTVGIVFEFFF